MFNTGFHGYVIRGLLNNFGRQLNHKTSALPVSFICSNQVNFLKIKRRLMAGLLNI